MKRQNSQTLTQAIELFFKRHGMYDKYEALHVAHLWKTMFGQHISDRTEKAEFRNGILYLKLTSSVLKEEVINAKDRIISELNKKVGRDLVEQIVLI